MEGNKAINSLEVKDIPSMEENKSDEQFHVGSHKITNFFPVLRSEGRAKMCSSKPGDAKQKEILQKLMSKDSISSTKVQKSQDFKFVVDSQNKTPQSLFLHNEKVRGNIMLSSALKTPLSQVLRKSIEASEQKKDEKTSLEQEKAIVPKLEKEMPSNITFETQKRKAKKSFVENRNDTPIRKSQTSITSHSAKIFTSTLRSSIAKKIFHSSTFAKNLGNLKTTDKNLSTSVDKNQSMSSDKNLSTSMDNNLSTSVDKNLNTSMDKNLNTSMDKNLNTSLDKNQNTSNSKLPDTSVVTVAVSEDLESNNSLSSFKTSSQKSSDAALKSSVTTEEIAAGHASPNQNTKTALKHKKGKRRHFRGGTYGLYLTPAKKRKRKQKSSPDSGSKDDECSLAGTENSSYIDSDDGNSLVSDDFNTPSEKSLVDDEPCPDSRNSPMLLPPDQKNVSIESKLVSEKKDEKQCHSGIDNTFKCNQITLLPKDDCDEAAVTISNPKEFEPLHDMQWETDIKTENSALDNQFNEVLKAPEYDDISNESFSNTAGFSYKKESHLDNMGDDASISTSEKFAEIELFGEIPNVDKEDLPNEVDQIEPNSEISINSLILDNANSDVSQNKDNVEDTSSHHENISGMMIDMNTIDDPGDAMLISPKSEEIDVVSYDNDNDKDEKETPLSTIATSVKSRQRIKRRFTDDIVDTDVGIKHIKKFINCFPENYIFFMFIP